MFKRITLICVGALFLLAYCCQHNETSGQASSRVISASTEKRFSAEGNVVDPKGDRQIEAETVRPISLELEQAVRTQNSEKVEELLSNGVSVEGITKAGKTLLHLASEYRDTRIALMLLRSGADPTVVCAQGERPVDVLIRNDYLAEEMQNNSYFEIQLVRTIDAIVRALEGAEALYAKGVERMKLRAELLEQSRLDQERAIRQASMYSFRQTGSRAAGPSSGMMMVPHEDRSSNAMWKNVRLKGEAPMLSSSIPSWKNTYEPKPLPQDLFEPLELPIPEQFDQVIKLSEWIVIRAALVYGTERAEFKSVVEKAKGLIDKAERASLGQF